MTPLEKLYDWHIEQPTFLSPSMLYERCPFAVLFDSLDFIKIIEGFREIIGGY
jgi:hypothetical protein